MSGATGKSEKGKTPNPTPSKQLFPSSAPPPLFQTSLLPVVSKFDPALRRSTRASSSTGCQASGASLPTAEHKVSKVLSNISKEAHKQPAKPLTDPLPPDASRPASPADDPQPIAEEDSDIELFESDEDVAPPPLPVQPPPLAPLLPVHPPPPAPPAPAPIDQAMADAAAAAAAAAAGIAAANQTASGIPPPPPFSGDTVAQCPQEWIRSLRYWIAFRNLNNAQTIAAIPVLLRASALIFYQGLPDGQKDTLDHFEASFLQHYRTEGTLPWLDLAALWQCKQVPPQTVEQYLNDIARLAQRTNAS